MKNTYIKTIALIAIAVVLVSYAPLIGAQPQDRTASFQLLNHPDGDVSYQLNVTIPQELSNYYSTKSHTLFTASDFPKYVTPYTLQPIADRLWQIYNNTEDFTNGALMLVHQITYKEEADGKYPAETLFEGYGDCDLFVYIAASILQAGGINTVLLYYKDQMHMEIGVDIGSAPKESRVDVFSVDYQNASYYIGECTGSNWRDGWRIGETPLEFQNASLQVVPLQNNGEISSGQVTATLKELDPSTLAVQVSSSLLLEGNTVSISGQILPQIANENVTIQTKTDNQGWTTIATVLTQADGRFEYTWTPSTAGSITFQANWRGNKQYNGAESSETNVTVMPMYLLAVIGTAVLAVGIVTFTFIATRRKKPKPPQLSSLQDTQPTTPPPAPTNQVNDEPTEEQKAE